MKLSKYISNLAKANPQLRVGQIIVNKQIDIFYLTDQELLDICLERMKYKFKTESIADEKFFKSIYKIDKNIVKKLKGEKK
jgi:hypothetical protein